MVREYLADKVAHPPAVAGPRHKGANFQNGIALGFVGERVQGIADLPAKQALGRQRGYIKGEMPRVAFHHGREFLRELQYLVLFLFLFLREGHKCQTARKHC